MHHGFSYFELCMFNVPRLLESLIIKVKGVKILVDDNFVYIPQ
jgi:hypothetical protein